VAGDSMSDCGRGISCVKLVKQRFCVRLSLASIGAVRARPSLTPQKPLQHAYQRDPDAMAPWQRETYPAISRQAKWDEGEIYFLGESGVRVNVVYGTTWGPRDSRRSDRCSASVRAPAPRRPSGRPCKGVRVGKPSNMCTTAQTTDGCLGESGKTRENFRLNPETSS